MVQRIAVFVFGLTSVGLLVALLTVTRAKDERIQELSGRIDDLSDGNRRARDEIAAGDDRVQAIAAETVAKRELEDVVARYEALLARERTNLESRDRQASDTARDLGKHKEELASLRSRLAGLEQDLSQKQRMLASMEKDRLEVIRQVVELEDFLAERERELAGLSQRFDKQDEVLEDLKRRNAENAERMRRILEKLQNDN